MRLWAALPLLVLAACETETGGDPLRPPAEAGAPAAPAARAAPLVTPQLDTPHIYMALQPDGTGATSIVFAIDADRDHTPGDDPAIRLTPEDGKCNPQELRSYAFPPETTRRPIFGPDEARAGLTARELPTFLAMAVTAEMLRAGRITDPDQSKPQNVCTRKLWERLILNESLRADEAEGS